MSKRQPWLDDSLTASLDPRPLRVVRPEAFSMIESAGIMHLVRRDAAGPPWSTLCQRSVLGVLQDEDPAQIMTPCPRCARIRIETQRWQ